MFRDTAEYRAAVERAKPTACGWSRSGSGCGRTSDVVVVRGRLRTRRGGVLGDTRMYWLHRVQDGKVVWTSSSPDLGGLLEEAGLDRGLAQEAFVALHREAA